MANLEKAYRQIVSLDNSGRCNIASPAVLIVTLIYLACVLSVPLYQPQRLVWLAAYPIVASEMEGDSYGRIFLKSLWILPLIIFIGIFNPFIDTETAFRIGNMAISRGWLSFVSILIRGLLSFQAVLLLVDTTGFIDIFNSLRKIGCPSVLTTQLLLTYRYIHVIIQEAISMKRAREARGYGRKSYPLKMWGQFIGQLLMRSMDRATRIHRAMDARGFDGLLPTGKNLRWNRNSWVWLAMWTAVIVSLRIIDLSNILKHILS